MLPNPPPVFVVPGMYVGCFPLISLNSGTLQCFFDSTCLNTTARWISNLPATDWPKPLNSSIKSRFLPNTSISLLLEEQMVEMWQNTTNFSGYYAACSPIQCTYTLLQFSGIVHIITTLISSLGGLIVVLRIMTPQLVKFQQQLVNLKLKRKETIVSPQTVRPGIMF